MSSVKAFARTAWAAVVLIPLVCVTLAAVVAAVGGRVSPLADVLTHLAPLYVGAALLAMIALAPVRGRPRVAALALGAVTLIASAALIAPEYLRDVGPIANASEDQQIKVIQFNGYRYNADVEKAVDWLIRQEPDIVTIQETRPDLRAAILARTDWQVAGLPSGTLTIFSARPRLAMHRPKAGGRLHWVNATYPSASGPYEVVAVHLDWPNSPRQPGQFATLTRMIQNRSHDRLILAGDFNSTPWSYALRELDNTAGVIRRDRGLFSFPSGGGIADPISLPVPILPIDHVYAGPGWATVKVERGPRLGSDHYPVVLTLAPIRR